MDILSIIDNMSWPLFIILWTGGLILCVILMWYGIHCSRKDGTIDKLSGEIKTIKDVTKKSLLIPVIEIINKYPRILIILCIVLLIMMIISEKDKVCPFGIC